VFASHPSVRIDTETMQRICSPGPLGPTVFMTRAAIAISCSAVSPPALAARCSLRPEFRVQRGPELSIQRVAGSIWVLSISNVWAAPAAGCIIVVAEQLSAPG